MGLLDLFRFGVCEVVYILLESGVEVKMLIGDVWEMVFIIGKFN